MRSVVVASVVALCAGASVANAGMQTVTRQFDVSGQLNLRVDGLPDAEGPTFFQVVLGPTGTVAEIRRGAFDDGVYPWEADDMLDDVVSNPLYQGNPGFGFEPVYEASTMTVSMPFVVGDEMPSGNDFMTRMGGDIYFDFQTNILGIRGTGTSNLGWQWTSSTRVGDSDFTAVLSAPITLAWTELVVGLPTITIEPDSFINYRIVPTPGAACLMGIAGIAGIRRRR